MTNNEFNEFYNTMLVMDEDKLHNLVLGAASVVMEHEQEKQKRRELEVKMNIRKERVM